MDVKSLKKNGEKEYVNRVGSVGGGRCSSRGVPRTGAVRVCSQAGCGVEGAHWEGFLQEAREIWAWEDGSRLGWGKKARKGILGSRNDISVGAEVSVSSMTTDEVGT